MENKGSSHVFTPSLLLLQERGDETWGLCYHRAARLGLKHEGLQTSGL